MSNEVTSNEAETQATPATTFLGAWQGGSVVKIALSPHFAHDGVALAATLAGLFRSEDGGQSWQLAKHGLPEFTLTTVEFAHGNPATPDANDGAVAFAGTEGGRLYKSVDLGRTWAECTAWAGLGVLTDLAVAPDFATHPYLFAATIGGAYRSLNGGDSWESCTFGLLDDEVLTMVCAPNFADNELVWCGTGGGGFYRSRNAAKAWREAGLGLPDSAVQALAVSPHFAQDRTLYAGMEDGGLYRSVDGGELWDVVGRATEPLPGAINCLALCPRPDTGDATPNHSLRILVGTNWGIFWSDTDGDSWEAAEGGDFIALDLAVGSAHSGETRLIAGALSDGLFIGTDGGRHWTPSPAAPAAHAPPLITAPVPGRLFALDHDGVMAQSLDNGETWIGLPGEFSQGHVADSAVFAVAAARQSDETLALYLAGDSHLLAGHTAPTNGAVEWRELAMPPTDQTAAAFLVTSPTFAVLPELVWGHYSGDMFLSQDGGASWELLARPWTADMTLSVTLSPNFAHDRRMVAVTGRQNEDGHFHMTVWESVNGGTAWRELAALDTETPAMLTALPDDPAEQAIFLATRHRLIRLYRPAPSTGEEATGEADELKAQQTMFDTEQRVTALAVSPDYAQDQTVLTGIDSTIYASHDAGARWQPIAHIPDGLPAVSLLTFTPGAPLTVISLGGASWQCPWPHPAD